MQNFVYHNITKIIFGRGTENNAGEETLRYSRKILLHYGGGSIKKSGLYDRVTNSLRDAGIDFIELGGVQPNPRLSLVQEGIRLCRENQINFILAVGGGSVIDSSKAIAMGVPYKEDVWNFYAGIDVPKEALPIGVVLTIPAAGSESSWSSVITNENGWYKRGLNNILQRPVFAIMNPELTTTLPAYQTSCGIVDMMAHIMERYFTNVTNVDLTDRLCEASLKSIIRNAPTVLAQPNNYDARAEIMWAGTLAHSDILGTGRIGDWASHPIEHELSAMYDVAHGAGLATIYPAWMEFSYKHDMDRFVQFAVRVWNADLAFDDPESTALEGIKRTKEFFRSIGMPVSLKELGVPNDKLEQMADKCTNFDKKTVGNFIKLNRHDVLNILKLADR